MDFLNTGGDVLASEVRDLRNDYVPLGGFFPGVQVVHPALVKQAPAGTVNVRVVAEALDMAWNGTAGPSPTGSEGGLQSAFFNDFSLKNSGGVEQLQNGDLNTDPGDALDFWNQVESPTDFPDFNQILRTPMQQFSNHTPGGSRGVWLSAFFGNTSNPNWSDEPVDGIISQTVQAVAGATYTFSGWTRFETNYSGGVDTVAGTAPSTMTPGATSPTRTEIKLEFMDVNNVVIGTHVIDVEAARKALAGGVANDGQWRQHQLQVTSPANTRFARLTAQMVDGVFNTDAGGGQSAFFDDFSLDGPAAMIASVPEPSSLAALATAVLLVGGRMRRR
jgi:hypothetical protein